MPVRPSPRSSFLVQLRSPWAALVVLTLINLLNYLDRMVLPAVGESIRRSELRPTDAQFGFLTSGFIIVYMLAAPFFGAWGDRWARPRLLAVGVAVWSLATAAGGLATQYGHLLGARAAVGIGEAAYGTIAPALLADFFPKRLRGRVFAVFFMATPVGSALGYVLGGMVDACCGWRKAFFIAGLPGLALALAALLLSDPPRGSQEQEDLEEAGGGALPTRGFRTYLVIARVPAYRRTVLGFAAYTFALGGIAVWMPSFLERSRGLTAQEATVQLGAVLVVTGLVGTFAGGWAGDWLLKKTSQAYLWLSGLSTLAAAPLVFLALTTTNRTTYWIALVVAELLIFASTGPINSSIVNAVSPAMRAAGMALCILTIHLLGDVPSPTLIGALSDRWGGSLERAMLIVPLAIVVSGTIWTWAAWKGPAARH
jgi:MFS family permease